MANDAAARCDECGFSAPRGDEAWETVDHPPIGRLTQCPECGSTNVYSR